MTRSTNRGAQSPRGGGRARGSFRLPLLLVAAALLLALSVPSCAPHAGRKKDGAPILSDSRRGTATETVPPSPSPPASPTTPTVPLPPSEMASPRLAMPPAGSPLPPAAEEAPPLPTAREEEVDSRAVLAPDLPRTTPSEGAEGVRSVPESPSPAPPDGEKATGGAAAGKDDRKKEKPKEKGKEKAPPRTHGAPPVPVRGWEREDLSFQVRYLGVPCGYARFTARGRVLLEGREAIHLQVRGWTSKLLSVVYPLDTTMDYYIDPATLLPLRIDQRKTERGKFKSSTAIYDQASGVITYWNRETGRMVKRVRTVPSVHDPVTVVYNIRTLDPSAPQSPRYVYAGKKIWQVQPRRLGEEKVADEFGKVVESVVLAPLIRREGQEEDKGDIRVWISRDPRHAPLRIYASIKLGAVEGRLVPTGSGGP